MTEVTCSTKQEIIDAQGLVINNPDGTISVYTVNQSTQQLAPQALTKACCDSLGIPGAYFDVDTQFCRWTASNAGPCDYTAPFNVVLNPKGNDGAIFGVTPDETCTLSVDYDYLFKFDCDTLTKLVGGTLNTTCTNVIDVLESIGASMVIEVVTITGNTTALVPIYEETFFQKIGAGNLYNYLATGSTESGFFICGELSNNTGDTSCYPLNLYDLNVTGDTINCITPTNQLLQSLYTESGLPLSAITTFQTNISADSFGPNWQHFHTVIDDASVVSAMTNQKIKLTIKVSGSCVDTYILLDNIELNKNCTKVLRNDIFVSQSPGFDLDRIRDNKKSWSANDTTTHRTFKIANSNDEKPIRLTDYFLDDERQIINTKEIDLDISIAAAVETDVWAYVVDNPCLLTGSSVGVSTCVKDAGFFSAGTTTTGVTGLTIITVQTGACSAITSTTFSCPATYSATPANDSCVKITVTGATFNGTGSTVIAGNTNAAYSQFGSYFYPDILNDGALPVFYIGSGAALKDQSGGTITPVTTVTTGTFWNNVGNTTDGRLNQVGLSASSTSYVGFTYCLDIMSGGTYYVGLGADNFARFKVNGVLIADFSGAVQDNFKKWSVFPIPLTSGRNIIEMQGKNDGTIATSFGAEIYNPIDFATLVAATNTGSTGANVIFSTAQFIGQTFDSGSNVGYSCPVGYALDGCGTGFTCTLIQTAAISGTSSVGYTPTTISGSCALLTGATPPNTVVITAQTLNVYSYTATTTTSTSGTTSAVTQSSIMCVPMEYCCSSDCGDAPIDINFLMTQPLSAITTVEDFEYFLTSELIDAKNRQTISSYPTLRLLYDRYMNSTGFCGTNSSKFDYFSMNKFANLIGNYWVDIIEQVIPATTIWGSTRIYGNTIFDSEKFKYKAYSTHFAVGPFTQNPFIVVSSPATGVTCGVSAETSVVLGSLSATTEFFNQGSNQKFDTVYVNQMNSGSEFLGTVTVVGPNSGGFGGNVINENL
jgi:hypothetical protein